MSRRSSTGSSKRRVRGARSEAKPSGVRTAKRSVRGARSEAQPSGVRTAKRRLLHLDCFSGIAGNMFLGAMLDLGLSRKQLTEDLAGLGLDYKLVVRKVMRGALACRYVDVKVPGERRKRDQLPPEGIDRRVTHHAQLQHHHHHRHGRSYAQIVKLLRGAKLDATVRRRALEIFENLGRAEAKVHGIALEKVHFHEVGAVDAIVDVTGAAIALARLGVERVTASPVGIGSGGTVDTDHGRLPLPAPATLELLRGIPTEPAHVTWETVTPTGAAILATVVESFGPLPAITIDRVGHGAGNDRPGPMPNVLRAVLGHAGGAGSDRVVCLETNLDDLPPEHFDYLMERLFEAGALDVSVQPLQMKKNRPGFLVRALGRPSERMVLAQVLFAESSAIGVRVTESDRIVLEREKHRVETPYGRIGVKRSWHPDGRPLVTAEYDDCKKAARKAGVPLRDVVRAAEEAGRELD